LKEKLNWTDKLSNIITLAGTAILMNLMFLVASLPIVTIGPAWCGLMSAIRYNIRGEGWFQGFKKGFCTRFWRSLIIWCICLPLCLFFLNDLNNAVLFAEEVGVNAESIVACIFPGLFLAMAGMVTVSMLTLNVYIPTDISNWIKNGVNFFRRPLELFAAAALFWAPLLVFRFYLVLFMNVIMVLVAAYFALAAVCGTMILKDPLIDFLIDARADGTLLAEEGSAPVQTEDEE
jgi:hypothetical protein